MTKLHQPTRSAEATKTPQIFIGTAGWAIPGQFADCLAAGSSHLERYAQTFSAAEINSSFYRTHRPRTYERWAATVPDEFRFSVKIPRTISHEARLDGCEALLRTFFEGVNRLGHKLGCVLLQLPPSLAWNQSTVLPFLEQLRHSYHGPVACEPRHLSWFQPEASRLLSSYQIARAAADPALNRRARLPAGDRQVQYLRLHGSPRMYRDAYTDPALDWLARRLHRSSARCAQRWCIFDNTAEGHALPNALALLARSGAAGDFHTLSARQAAKWQP